jgi:probable HAF family extracellular repeat protein
LGALDDPGGGSEAWAVNADGLVAGWSSTGGPEIHAVLWTPYGISNLGSLGGRSTSARAISGDLIVGYSQTPTGALHAFLYDNNGPGYLVDLNDLIAADSGWVLDNASGVNTTRQIVGGGYVPGAYHAFLLTPVRPYEWKSGFDCPGGNGLDRTSYALAVFDDGAGAALYVGGQFLRADDVAVSGIAKWDGSRWTAVGGPAYRTVRALTVFDDGAGPALYFAGSEPGGFTVANWNGVTWTPVGGGMWTALSSRWPCSTTAAGQHCMPRVTSQSSTARTRTELPSGTAAGGSP